MPRPATCACVRAAARPNRARPQPVARRRSPDCPARPLLYIGKCSRLGFTADHRESRSRPAQEARMHVEDKDLVTALSQQADGPALSAAIYARVSTAMSFTRWLGPLGNYLVARPAARAAAHRDEERTDMPLDAAVVLGLDPQALHVWAADPMLSQVHDHLGTVDIARITAIRTEIAKSWWPLSITLDRKSTRLNSSHLVISYAVFC